MININTYTPKSGDLKYTKQRLIDEEENRKCNNKFGGFDASLPARNKATR